MSQIIVNTDTLCCERRHSEEGETELDRTITMHLVQDPANIRRKVFQGNIATNRIVKSNLPKIRYMLSSGKAEVEDEQRHSFILPMPEAMMSYMHNFQCPEDSVWHIHKLMMAKEPTTQQQNRIYNTSVQVYRRHSEKLGKDDIWTPPSQGQRRRAMHRRLFEQGKITESERAKLNSGQAVIRDNKVVPKSILIGTAITLSTSSLAEAYCDISACVPDATFGYKLSALVLLAVLSTMARNVIATYNRNRCRFSNYTFSVIILAIYSPILIVPLFSGDPLGNSVFSFLLYGFLTSSLLHAADTLPRIYRPRDVLIHEIRDNGMCDDCESCRRINVLNRELKKLIT